MIMRPTQRGMHGGGRKSKAYKIVVVLFFMCCSTILQAETMRALSDGPGLACGGECSSCIEQAEAIQPRCLSSNAHRVIWMTTPHPSFWAHKGLQCGVMGPCWTCPTGWFFVNRPLYEPVNINNGPVCLSPDTIIDKQDRTCPMVADPIIIATGNSFQTEVDFQSQAPFGLKLVRYYNSNSNSVDVGIGKNWRNNYNRSIQVSDVYAAVHRENGQTFLFNYDGNTWQGDVDIPDTLVELKDTAGNRTGWVYTDSHDNVERYNLSGQLISITRRTGQSQTLSYDIASIDGGDDDNTTLDKVTGFNGEVMSFTYDAHPFVKRMTSMTDPQGHRYLYHYDTSGNLINVTYPDNTPDNTSDNPTRTYHYENVSFPHHLTGRTDETGSLTTWTYDSQGRAIGNELDGGAENYSLAFNSDGSVTTTNPLGKTTTYHFTTLHGVKKVTQVEGHATASCAAANKNYTYDANGYLASKTDWQGNVTTYVHNARGLETSRTEAFGTPEARTITTDWHATFRLPIKITEPGKVTDFIYDSQGRLISQTVTAP